MSALPRWATPTHRSTGSPKAVQPSWNIAVFRSMRSRTCFRAPQPTAKPLECSFPSQLHSRGDR